MICHSKKCDRPHTSSRHKNSEMEQNTSCFQSAMRRKCQYANLTYSSSPQRQCPSLHFNCKSYAAFPALPALPPPPLTLVLEYWHLESSASATAAWLPPPPCCHSSNPLVTLVVTLVPKWWRVQVLSPLWAGRLRPPSPSQF